MLNIVPKIIALSCSPSRRRNSDSMLDAFLKGVAKYEIDIEKIYLSDVSIDFFTFENRNGPQAHEQEFAQLVEKLKCAQGLIIATPTYNFSVPAHLKNFMDRIRCFALDIENKNTLNQPKGLLHYLKTYFIVSGGTPRWAQRILFFAFPPFWLRSVFLYYNAVVYGAFYSGDVCTFKNTKILNQCTKAGEKYAKKLLKDSKNPILEQIFWRPPQRD